MKRASAAVVAALIAAPVFAQAAGATQMEAEARGLLETYVAMFNRGDAAGLAREVYAGIDQAALEERFNELRADSFGKLDVYSAAVCAIDADHGRALLKYARIYTFGGKMNDDEAKVFDLAKTPAGWRVASETDVAFEQQLSCR